MQRTITRKVAGIVLALMIAFAVVFAILSVASYVAPDSTFAAFGIQIASAFGGDGGGDGGGGGGGDGGGGGGDGGGCCGGGDGGGGQGGPPDTGPNPGSYVEPPPPSPPPPPPAPPATPICTLSANPTSFGVGGGNSVLTWTTVNATSASINQGIGAVALNGSRNTVVTSSVTYTLTASGPGGTVNCSAPISVAIPSGLSCDSFSASPNSFGENGGNTTLTWNTTGATSVSIDQGIGSVSTDGSRSVVVTSSRTFTLTATDGTDTVTCPAPVTVEEDNNNNGGGGGGSAAPRCEEFRASDTTIDEGDIVTLSWETNRGTRLKIDHDVIETRDDDLIDEGDIRVKPNRTTKYELTVYKGSRKDTCTVTVRVNDIEIADAQPATSVSFREIPYTGFEAGPMLTSLFYTLLALWGAAVAYVLVIKRESLLGFSLPARREVGRNI